MSELLSDNSEGVGFITLNRPQVHNAISLSMWQNIPALMTSMREGGARVIVFRGTGESFASGADLDDMRKINSRENAAELWHAIRNCLEFVWSFDLPVIASINGSCIGGGCLLASSCDFRIATTSSRFAVPVAKLGLLLDDRTIGRLVAAGGAIFAREILMAARVISSERALTLGFLLETVSPFDLASATSTLAQQILNNVDASVGASKRSINAAVRLIALDEITADNAVINSYLSDEFRRGVNSA